MIKKSLVVNDDAISLLIASKLFKKAGFSGEIVTADNGKNALAYFSDIIGKGEDCFEQAPQFVFLNLYIPVMNGWDFLKIFFRKICTPVSCYQGSDRIVFCRFGRSHAVGKIQGSF